MKGQIRREPTGDQVKGPPVLGVRSHLTGQEVQLGWWSIDLKTNTYVLDMYSLWSDLNALVTV